MVRVGIIGFDTSHAVEFTKRINHIDIPQDQWVEGCQIVMGYPGGSSSFVSDEVLAKRTQMIQHFGVQIVDSADALIGDVDAVLLESQEGGMHLEQTKPFLEAGLPLFIDKPFTCSVADAKEIADIACKGDVPIFSSSSLRYALEVQNLKARVDLGAVLGVDVYSPGTIHPKNPGLFNYGVHGVETIYALMGMGCQSVRCTWERRWEQAVGRWEDGRIGTLRAMREGALRYGFTAFCEKGIVQSTIDAQYIYRELLKRVTEMFQTGNLPISIDETIEIVAFMEAALKSAHEKGTEQSLPT